MSRVFYNTKTEQWYSREEGKIFGQSQLAVGKKHSLSFSIRQQNERLGPLVGILTSGTREGKLYGDFKRFAAIQTALQEKGGISFVFSPHSLQDTYIDGYIWLLKKHWYKCRFPYPDVVYNRIPYRKHEQRTETTYAIKTLTEKGIPLFNPCFFSKWEMYQAFFANKALQPHLLETRLLQTIDDLHHMLSSHQAIYIKQVEAAKGKRLLYLRRLSPETVWQKDLDEEQIKLVSDVWKMISQQSESFIAQRALITDTQNGRKYDLRVAVHYVHGAFCVSGIGVRLAQKGQIVTHVPHGGEIIGVEELQRPVDRATIQMLAEHCGQSLCSRFGHVREFSLDIGVNEAGQYYVFEANSKPMIFDEPDIYKKTLHNLLTLFAEEAGFPPYIP